MITIHHLGVSQSDRIVWLMEELGLPYELKWYDRGPDFLAPPEYLALHPAATSPVITDGKLVLAESAAICEYVSQRYAGGKLSVAPDQPNYPDYLYFMHWNNNVQGMFFAKLAVVEAANWLIPLAVVLVLARLAGFGRAALPLIIAFNWLSVPLQWAYVPVSLLQIWAPADTSAALLYLLTLGTYVFITYRISVAILGGQKFPAFVLVMVVFSVPLMVQSQLLAALGLVDL